MSRPLIEISELDGVTIVRFVDVVLIDLAKIQEIGEALNALPNDHDRTKILVNFKGVKGVNSWMIGKILSLQGVVTKRGGKLVCCNLGPELLGVFVEVGFDKVIPIVTDEETGLKAF